MYIEKLKTDAKRTDQALTHEGWINRNLLYTLARAVTVETEYKQKQEPEQAGTTMQQRSWIPWPAFLNPKA